jgi:hypothetical protein
MPGPTQLRLAKGIAGREKNLREIQYHSPLFMRKLQLLSPVQSDKSAYAHYTWNFVHRDL